METNTTYTPEQITHLEDWIINRVSAPIVILELVLSGRATPVQAQQARENLLKLVNEVRALRYKPLTRSRDEKDTY